MEYITKMLEAQNDFIKSQLEKIYQQKHKLHLVK